MSGIVFFLGEEGGSARVDTSGASGELELSGIGGMGFPSLPRVCFPIGDVRFANRDAGVF